MLSSRWKAQVEITEEKEPMDQQNYAGVSKDVGCTWFRYVWSKIGGTLAEPADVIQPKITSVWWSISANVRQADRFQVNNYSEICRRSAPLFDR